MLLDIAEHHKSSGSERRRLESSDARVALAVARKLWVVALARWALALGGGCSEAEPTYGARLSGCGRLEYSTVK